jgi:hypothetical protein
VQSTLTRIALAALVAWAAVIVVMVAVLAVVHVDDRYGVSAASGVWMGLAAAARDGVWYPPLYAHGFFGGTRYMPLPILFELVGRAVSGEYLVSAKLLIYAVNVPLYVLFFRAAKRRSGSAPIAFAIVATVLTSSAAATTVLAFRWDALALLLQVIAVELIGREATPRSTIAAGVVCGLAITTKVTALWAPAAIVVWLVRKPRELGTFAGSLAVTTGAIVATIDALSHGRMLHQLREFTFAGSGNSTFSTGFHRFYHLGLRDQRELPLLLALAVVSFVAAVAARRVGIYELGLLFAVPIVIVVMRDFGAYENHLLDLELLSGLAVAGLWGSPHVRRPELARVVVAAALVLASCLAARLTLIPDARAAASHELRGRADTRYAVQPLPAVTAQGTCALFEDGSVPILAGQRPIVLDAFITHRLQTEDPRVLQHLLGRIERGGYRTIALTFPLTNIGWFQTLDFGSAFVAAVEKNYHLTATAPGFFLYVPRHPSAVTSCNAASLDDWH